VTLELHALSAGYGPVEVVHEISLTVGPGQIVTLIGANGAGKSTLVKTISGIVPARSGTITYEGRRIDTLPPSARVAMGIAHVPEGRQVFAGLTVAENLQLGGYAIARSRSADEANRKLQAVFAKFPMLQARMGDPAGNLSGGQQQMLAIARGLMADPKLLILDEPSLGLAPIIVREIFALIGALREQGLGILLSEQNASLSLAISDHGHVIENGCVTLSGTGAELLQSSEVAERYLGVGAGPHYGTSDEDAELANQLRSLRILGS